MMYQNKQPQPMGGLLVEWAKWEGTQLISRCVEVERGAPAGRAGAAGLGSDKG